MTEEEYQKYMDLQEQLLKAFREYAVVVGIKNGDRYTIDGEVWAEFVDFRTDNYHGDGGGYYRMPTQFIFDRAAWQAERDAEQTEEAKRIADKIKKEAVAKEESERAQLAELLKRYGPV
jgi:hypothetical protein